jgi:hypothetical protein
VPNRLQDQLDQLLASINPEVIKERGYWSATTWQQLDGLLFKASQKPVACFPALVIPQWRATERRLGKHA